MIIRYYAIVSERCNPYCNAYIAAAQRNRRHKMVLYSASQADKTGIGGKICRAAIKESKKDK